MHVRTSSPASNSPASSPGSSAIRPSNLTKSMSTPTNLKRNPIAEGQSPPTHDSVPTTTTPPTSKPPPPPNYPPSPAFDRPVYENSAPPAFSANPKDDMRDVMVFSGVVSEENLHLIQISPSETLHSFSQRIENILHIPRASQSICVLESPRIVCYHIPTLPSSFAMSKQVSPRAAFLVTKIDSELAQDDTVPFRRSWNCAGAPTNPRQPTDEFQDRMRQRLSLLLQDKTKKMNLQILSEMTDFSKASLSLWRRDLYRGNTLAIAEAVQKVLGELSKTDFVYVPEMHRGLCSNTNRSHRRFSDSVCVETGIASGFPIDNLDDPSEKTGIFPVNAHNTPRNESPPSVAPFHQLMHSHEDAIQFSNKRRRSEDLDRSHPMMSILNALGTNRSAGVSLHQAGAGTSTTPPLHPTLHRFSPLTPSPLCAVQSTPSTPHSALSSARSTLPPTPRPMFNPQFPQLPQQFTMDHTLNDISSQLAHAAARLINVRNSTPMSPQIEQLRSMHGGFTPSSANSTPRTTITSYSTSASTSSNSGMLPRKPELANRSTSLSSLQQSKQSFSIPTNTNTTSGATATPMSTSTALPPPLRANHDNNNTHSFRRHSVCTFDPPQHQQLPPYHQQQGPRDVSSVLPSFAQLCTQSRFARSADDLLGNSADHESEGPRILPTTVANRLSDTDQDRMSDGDNCDTYRVSQSNPQS